MGYNDIIPLMIKKIILKWLFGSDYQSIIDTSKDIKEIRQYISDWSIANIGKNPMTGKFK